MIEAMWVVAQSPLIWVPVLTATIVWVFMCGYGIGRMR